MVGGGSIQSFFLNFCFCNEPLWLAHYNFFFIHWTIPKIKMLRCFPLAHLLGYESSILGKTYCLMCRAIANMLGFTHWVLVEHMWGISLGTLWEHTWNMMGTQNPQKSKFPLGNELLSPKGEKICPARCRLSCHFSWLHKNLICDNFWPGPLPLPKSVHT